MTYYPQDDMRNPQDDTAACGSGSRPQAFIIVRGI